MMNLQTRFERLTQENYKRVYSFAYTLTGSKLEAEDLTQEALYRAYRGFETFSEDRVFLSWVFKIVRNTFLDMRRNQKRKISAQSMQEHVDGGEYEYEIPDISGNPEYRFFEEEKVRELQDLLNRLSPEHREVVVLAEVQGLSYEGIAEQVGKPVGTVRSRLHRARMELRKLLHKENSTSSLTPAI